jgi:hypothetical protein
MMHKSLLILGGISLLAMPFVMSDIVHAQNQTTSSAPTMGGTTPGQGTSDSSTGVPEPANPPPNYQAPQPPANPKDSFVSNKSSTDTSTSSMKKKHHKKKGANDSSSEDSMSGSNYNSSGSGDSTPGSGMNSSPNSGSPMGPTGAH